MGALLLWIAVTNSGTSKLGNRDVYKLPGPSTINSALAIASSISPVIAEEEGRGLYATVGAGLGKHLNIDIDTASGGDDIEFGYPKDIHDSKILLNNIINSIQEVKGDEVCTIDLRNVENNFCSYFVICNGTSNTHVNSIVGSIQKKISKEET